MRGPPFAIILAIAVGLILAACGSPAGSTEPGASSGNEPSTAPAESQGDSGGGGGGDGLTLPDGAWTGGHASTDIGGEVDSSFEGDLFTATSLSAGGQTFLQYLSTDGEQIAVAIYPDSVAVSVVTTEFAGGGGSTESGGQCVATFSRSDDNAVEGSVHCEDAPMVTMSGAANQLATIDVDFSATR